jgi:hypothetical protein
MIEKKIFYNEPKPTKVSNIKPVMQGGKLNYLGKQKTITAPVKWKSGPTHPITHLAYISDEEQKVLVKLNMYKSMNGKPNKGPFGIVSLNDGDGSGGDSGGASGGSGGSDASGNAGNATGDSAGVGGSGGTSGPGGGQGPGGESGTGGADSGPGTGGPGGAQEGFGIGPDDAIDTSISQPAEAMETVETDPMAIDPLDSRAVATIKALSPFSLDNPNRNVFSRMAQITGPVGIALGLASSLARGVSNPDDYSQVDTSVQSPAPAQDTGGVNTIQNYAPLYNTDTLNSNEYEALKSRLEYLLKKAEV